MFDDIEKSIGLEGRRFLEEITPDHTQGKLTSTGKAYLCGLTLFSEYLGQQTIFPEVTNIGTFFKAVRKDNAVEDTLMQQFPDRKLIKGFLTFLGDKTKPCVVGQGTKPKYSPKSMRDYIVPILSMGKLFKIPVSAAYTDMPPSQVQNEKYPWTLKQVGEFIEQMDNPLYECIATWELQSALSNYDLLHLTYGKLKGQLKSGVAPLCLSLYRHKVRKFEVRFRTFLGSLSLDYFGEYLSERKTSYQDDDRIFKLSSVALEGFFKRRAVKMLGEKYNAEFRNPMSPASLRSAFRTFLCDGFGSDGSQIPSHYIEFMMGHKLGHDLMLTYTTKSDASWAETYKIYEPLLDFKH